MTAAVDCPADAALAPSVTLADVLAHRGLVVRVLKRYEGVARRRGIEFDDLFNAGLEIVWRALREPRPAVRCKTSTYLGNQLRWGLLGMIRQGRVLQRLPEGESGQEMTEWPVEMEEDQAVQKNLVAELLKHLPAQERRAVELRFGLQDGQPRTLAEMGGVLGVTATWAGQLVRSALDRLRREMERRGLG